MTPEQLSPYWGQAHEELLETVRLLSSDQLSARPKAGTVSIRDIVLRFLHEERFWASHVVAGNAYEVPRSNQFPDARSLVEALAATRDVTVRVLAPIGPDGLRAVRRVPADPQTNRPESNMPVGLLFWHVIERELFAWGQVQLRLDDEREQRR